MNATVHPRATHIPHGGTGTGFGRAATSPRATGPRANLRRPAPRRRGVRPWTRWGREQPPEGPRPPQRDRRLEHGEPRRIVERTLQRAGRKGLEQMEAGRIAPGAA